MILSRGALGSVLLLTLSLTGCDDPPTCRLNTIISGATSGAADWSLSGEDNCGFISSQSLTTGGATISYIKGSDQIILVIDTAVPDVGIYPGTIIFSAGGFIWQGPDGACSVGIDTFDVEGWSLQDFITISGTFSCQQPLVSTDPNVDDLILTNLTFQAHLYDELIATPNF